MAWSSPVFAFLRKKPGFGRVKLLPWRAPSYNLGMNRRLLMLLVSIVALGSTALAYDGVRPGAGNPPPAPPKSSKHNYVTWPGFIPQPGGARVFVQTTKTPQYDVQVAGQKVTVLIRNSRVHLRTNRLPLDMRYFNTPLLTAKLERRKKDVALVIDLKESAHPNVRVDALGGYSYIYVDF